jgi:hypothetical protein
MVNGHKPDVIYKLIEAYRNIFSSANDNLSKSLSVVTYVFVRKFLIIFQFSSSETVITMSVWAYLEINM